MQYPLYQEHMGQPILLAVRVMDGLFVGNAVAAQDDEFLMTNKVTHVINCAATEMRNYFIDHGMQYLSFSWKDNPSTVIIDPNDRNIMRITKFIEKAFERGECVLVHSFFGVSRCCVVAAAFLINRYGWSLENTLNFIHISHPDMDIKPYFIKQLQAFAKKKKSPSDIFDSNVVTFASSDIPIGNEQLVLKNTYLNSLPISESTILNQVSGMKNSKKVGFASSIASYSSPGKLRSTINGFKTVKVKSILKKKNDQNSASTSHELHTDTNQISQLPGKSEQNSDKNKKSEPMVISIQVPKESTSLSTTNSEQVTLESPSSNKENRSSGPEIVNLEVLQSKTKTQRPQTAPAETSTSRNSTENGTIHGKKTQVIRVDPLQSQKFIYNGFTGNPPSSESPPPTTSKKVAKKTDLVLSVPNVTPPSTRPSSQQLNYSLSGNNKSSSLKLKRPQSAPTSHQTTNRSTLFSSSLNSTSLQQQHQRVMNGGGPIILSTSLSSNSSRMSTLASIYGASASSAPRNEMGSMGSTLNSHSSSQNKTSLERPSSSGRTLTVTTSVAPSTTVKKKKKKKVKKKATESRLMRPTQSFLRKTVKK